MSRLAVAVPPQWKRQWDDLLVQLRDPLKLRVTMISFVAGLGLIGVYRPLSAELAILRRDVTATEDRLAIVRAIEQLRSTRLKLLENLPHGGDSNFWSEYLLGGIRESGVILRTLESSQRKTKVGKLQNVYFDLEIAGSFSQVHRLIAWIETGRYFARITKLRIKGERGAVQARLAVSLLVAPSSASEKRPAAKPEVQPASKPAAQGGGHGA